MAAKVTELFDELVRIAGSFVERQKGAWDHSAWLDFLSGVQKKGVDVSEDVQRYIGSMLEAMKKLYNASATTESVRNALLDISEQTVEFIKKTKGVWEQRDAEIFLKELQKRGIELSEETKSYLGGVLESVKRVYDFSVKITEKK
ncbi:MAG: hypothetical protein HQL05_12525 [Nitrospirae bacterium]|uniref:hypothetical protein n=1 Tax=Candidatus Magnetobacterium casense TaxID=1455061 RepID=UPI00058CC556|nr:hypothetical protein [Candidatus Magnetobacterium casensis]MBF0338640.1 hypothetical protein [Nitrospirota bacterium]